MGEPARAGALRVRRMAGAAALALAIAASAQEVALPGGARGGPAVERGPQDRLGDGWRAEVRADLDRRVAGMLAAGAIRPAGKAVSVAFAWPVRLVPGAPDLASDVIANYVDQDALSPDKVRDWSCGTRSYDLASGYNHRGTDFAPFPFGWIKMDRDEAIVVAAAAGTIIRKDDGAWDRNCGATGSLPPDTPVNTIYVRHPDGSIAWYVHLKRGSLTPKSVGESVAAGERLGSIGSSGSSSAPHLHFEVYSAQGALIDPFAGACNALNADSWWSQQPPYWSPAVVRQVVNVAPPSLGDCTTPATPNQAGYHQAGTTIYPTLFLRDFLKGASVPLRVLRPDGATFLSWSETNDQADYVSSFWYWPVALPPDAPAGAWTFEARLGGRTTTTTFHVVPATPARATAVEYFHAGFGHYFVTADAAEIGGLDAGAYGGVWKRTGRAFDVYAGAAPGLAPVCRFFSASFAPKSSHFYTADPVECAGVKANPHWVYEGTAFHVPMPDAAGTCPSGTLPVYRMYNHGQTGAPNHRFTPDYATRLDLVGRFGWDAEGAGPVGVGMCSPQ